MKTEDKELLLKDLCARLPYRVKVHLLLPETMENGYTLTEVNTEGTTVGVFLDKGDDSRAFRAVRIENEDGEQSIKPYLRSMSSMTEEEEIYYNIVYVTLKFWEKEDWLNEHHFDYRGLIPMGLALEAPADMYKN